MDTWHYNMGWIWAGRQNSLLVNIAAFGELVVPFPSISAYNRAWFNGTPDERKKAFCANIGDAPESNTTKPHRFMYLHGDCYNGLFLGMSPAYTFLQTSDIGLIYLHMP